MSFSETQNAKKYASIAEVAAAQAKIYADKLEDAPDYAAQAEAAAAQASTSAQSALNAQNGANAAASQASESANEAVLAAESAEGAAEAVFGSSLHAPTGEVLSTLPSAAGRVNTVPVFDGSGDAAVKDIADFAILDSNGKIPVSMIPAVALSEVFVVNSQAAMLALTAQEGDVAKRTDLGYSFILASEPASTLSNWVQVSDDVLAQLGLSTGATEVGAVDDDNNSTTVQGALGLKASKAYLSASAGATRIGVGSTTVDNLLVKFSPLRYGAKADGTNDTASFTACMAAMPSGATMDLQGLTYSVTDIEVTKPMRIINGNINVLYASLKGGIWGHDTSNIRIDNVNVTVDYANKSSYTAANVSGIIFENCTNVVVTNGIFIGSKNNNYLSTGSWGCPLHAYQCDGVTFHNCKASNSDKEGIMTRFCNNVKYGLLTATDCGYSGVGTSGGNGLIACNIWSYRSGLTNASFNSTNFTVAGIYTEGNLDEGGICLGHTHEVAQYAGSGTASGLTIINSAKSGLVVGKHKNITISGVTIDTIGTVTPGAGIVINDAMEANCNVVISDFNLKNITGTGINYLFNGSTNLTIDGGIIQGCTLNSIQAQHNGYTNIRNVTFRGNSYDIAVFPFATDGTQKMTALNIQNCDMEFTTNWNVVFRGVQYVKFDNVATLGFNSASATTISSIRCDTVVGSTFELPDSLEFNGCRFTGNVGSGVAATIVINDDGLATTGKRLKVNGCHFSDISKKPIQYTSSRMAMQWGRNTRGTDVGTQTVSLPSTVGGTVVITNSNITAEGMPLIVPRGASWCYVTSWSLGTITLANGTATSINVTVQH